MDQSMRLGQIRRTATLLLLAALVACEVQSQTTTSGALAGTVVDQTNAVVSDADVIIRDYAKGTIQSTRTNEEGVYRFLFLAPALLKHAGLHVQFERRGWPSEYWSGEIIQPRTGHIFVFPGRQHHRFRHVLGGVHYAIG
jgi:Carboxypeptidase regulatory-like domain